MTKQANAQGPAGRMKARLRADLRMALKEKRTDEIRVLRALLGALDNAEAPPLQTALPDASEIERLQLSADAVRDVISAEIDERDRAAIALDEAGRPDLAGAVRAEACIARRYVGS